LTFASFRTAKQGIKGVGVAAGPIAMKAVLKKMVAAKISRHSPQHGEHLPDGWWNGELTFLDDSTLLVRRFWSRYASL